MWDIVGKNIIILFVACIAFKFYDWILDKLALKERTKQIAWFILDIVLAPFFIFGAVALKMPLYLALIFALYICLGIVSGLLKLCNKEQLAKKMDKISKYVFRFMCVVAIVNWIMYGMGIWQ